MTDGSVPELSIVICTWNRSALLVETLTSILACEPSSLLRTEIIVVDNNSNDGTKAAVMPFVASGHVRYVFEGRAGLSHARNRGTCEAAAEWVLFLDDDVLVERDFLAQYFDGLERFPRCGFFGGPVVPYFRGADKPWTRAVLQSHPWTYSCLDLGSPTRLLGALQTPFGANMCIRRDLLCRHPFSPDLGYRHGVLVPGEETELFARIRMEGADGAWLAECALLHVLPDERNQLGYLTRRAFGQGLTIGRAASMQGRSVRWIIPDSIKALIQLFPLALTFRPSLVSQWLRIVLNLGVLRGALSNLPQEHFVQPTPKH